MVMWMAVCPISEMRYCCWHSHPCMLCTLPEWSCRNGLLVWDILCYRPGSHGWWTRRLVILLLQCCVSPIMHFHGAFTGGWLRHWVYGEWFQVCDSQRVWSHGMLLSFLLGRKNFCMSIQFHCSHGGSRARDGICLLHNAFSITHEWVCQRLWVTPHHSQARGKK